MGFPNDDLHDGEIAIGYLLGDEHGAGNVLGSQVPHLPEQVLPGSDGDQNMGALSGNVPLTADHDAIYSSNASPDFSVMDREHSSGPDNQQGFDSMRGLALPKPVINQPEQEKVYGYPDVPFPDIYSDAHSAVPEQQADGAYDE